MDTRTAASRSGLPPPPRPRERLPTSSLRSRAKELARLLKVFSAACSRTRGTRSELLEPHPNRPYMCRRSRCPRTPCPNLSRIAFRPVSLRQPPWRIPRPRGRSVGSRAAAQTVWTCWCRNEFHSPGAVATLTGSRPDPHFARSPRVYVFRAGARGGAALTPWSAWFDMTEGGLPLADLRPRAGRLPGDVCSRTKHIRATRRVTWRAFHRGAGDIYVEDLDSLANHPERVAPWLPTCCESGFVIQRVAMGDWSNLPRFVPETVSLERITPPPTEEEEDRSEGPEE